MTNGRIVDIENEVLRNRLATIKAAAEDFANIVTRYVEPKKGDPYCSRTELLQARNNLKALLK